MERRGFQNDDGTFLLDLVKIALGVFIGGLAAMFAYEGITAWRVEQALIKEANKVKQAQRKADEREAKEQADREQRSAERRQQAQAQHDAYQASQALQRARAQRKESAWAAFYQPSQACTLDPTTASCANEFISARKRFEAQYKDD